MEIRCIASHRAMRWQVVLRLYACAHVCTHLRMDRAFVCVHVYRYWNAFVLVSVYIDVVYLRLLVYH